MPDHLLEIVNLQTVFDLPGHGARPLHAVRDVSITVERGQTLGLVGESGSGKSITALSILRLIARPGRVTGGKILFNGSDILKLSQREMRSIRGSRIAMIFQDPTTALNPTMTIGEQIAETIRVHQKVNRAQSRLIALEWLRKVHMSSPERRYGQYPHELSGGMCQRVMIAIAFSCRPDLLIADEPTTALDVTVEAQILDLMDDLKQETGTGILLITHDLNVVRERCSSVAVMYAGQIVENAPTKELFDSPRMPYTQALLASLPDWRVKPKSGPLPFLTGQPPSLSQIPHGCPFHPRCSQAFDACRINIPKNTVLVEDKRSVRCLLYEKQVND